jgi:lariat debranching enzyme
VTQHTPPHHHPQIAIEGCAHGELDAIYATLQALEAKQGITIDLLICCGDFQAVRGAALSRSCKRV